MRRVLQAGHVNEKLLNGLDTPTAYTQPLRTLVARLEYHGYEATLRG
jgi:hypothetical protein